MEDSEVRPTESYEPASTTGRRMASEAAASVGMRYTLILLSGAISVLVTRSLAASGRGEYAWIVAYAASVIGVSNMSIETSLYLSWHERRAHRDRLVVAAMLLAVILGGAAAVVGYFLAPILKLTPPETSASSAGLLAFALGIAPAALLGLYLNAVLVNEGQIRAMNRAALAISMIQLAVTAVFVAGGLLTVAWAVILWAISTAAPILLLVPAVRGVVGFRRPRVEDISLLISRGLKFHGGSVALALIMRVDILILVRRVDAAQVGIYSLAVVLAELALLATAASSQVAVQEQLSGDPRQHGGITAAFSRANALLASIMMAAIVSVSPVVVPRVFGESFRGAAAPLLALAPGIVALSIMRPLGVFVTRLERPISVNAALIGGLVANVVLNLALIPRWGIIGAAVASSLVYLALCLWAAAWFLKVTGLRWRALRPAPSDVISIWNALHLGEKTR